MAIKIWAIAATFIAVMLAMSGMKNGWYNPNPPAHNTVSALQTTNRAGLVHAGDAGTGIWYSWEPNGNLLVIDKARNISWEAKH